MNSKTINYTVIFITGAITLSVELLSSRILKPFFGESLLIWSGILSVTLTGLAIGYYIGGYITKKYKQLGRIYYTIPSIAGIWLIIVNLFYPKFFWILAKTDITVGAYVACTTMLFIPLVALSAMNPLLVALLRGEDKSTKKGDGGAGAVFFISTIGSVIGVLITAFIFIPNISNYNSVLILSFLLLIISGMYYLKKKENKLVLVLIFLAIILQIYVLFFGYNNHIKGVTVKQGEMEWTVQEEYQSFYGSIKIIKIYNKKSKANFKLFLQEGVPQSIVDAEGLSVAAFSYVLEALARGFIEDSSSILCLGLGAGNLPISLAQKGHSVEVVEINPICLKVAVKHFNYDTSIAPVIIDDARVHVKYSRKKYDLIVIDVYQADLAPDYLVTKEFFKDLSERLAQNGKVILYISSAAAFKAHPLNDIIKTIQTVIPNTLLYYDEKPADDGVTTAAFIVACSNKNTCKRKPARVEITENAIDMMNRVFKGPKPISRHNLLTSTVFTDNKNNYQWLVRKQSRLRRQYLISQYPYELLIN